MNNTFPARLYAVFARDKPLSVVFRRGPSKQVCTFLWDREKDIFTLGQWLKGRIYEKRSDVSPDGKYLIYFAMNAKWDSETKGSWTAISKAPWLKAIELYPKGDCWEGGGLFLSKNKFWLNDKNFYPNNILSQSSEVVRDEGYQPEGEFGAEDTGVYYRRLLRDDWSLTSTSKKSKYNSVTIFEKQLKKGWVLRKTAHEQVDSPKGKGCYWDEHELFNKTTNVEVQCNDWEWAELDKNTIVWATRGCIYRATIKTNKSIGEAKLLFDFNSFKFERVQAPY